MKFFVGVIVYVALALVSWAYVTKVGGINDADDLATGFCLAVELFFEGLGRLLNKWRKKP